jgi:hypothetical protein
MIAVMINGSATDNLSSVVSTVFKVSDEYNQVEPKISAFGNTISLEAWRNAKDTDGRTYSIFVDVKDKAGNETKKSTTVICK